MSVANPMREFFDLFKNWLKIQAITPLMGLETHIWRYLIDLDSFIMTDICLIDDATKEILQGRRLRRRGPEPTMTDSEVLLQNRVLVERAILGVCRCYTILSVAKR